MSDSLTLYNYAKSSAAYRVRIALNLKGLDFERVNVNLLESEQQSEQYKAVNPQGLVPCLATESGVLSQSLAILEWLEERYPSTPLLPHNPWQKAQVRSLMYSIACDIHPIDNLRVQKYLTGVLQVSEQQKLEWYQHWIILGFTAIEQQLSAPFCFGEKPSLADCILIPQVYNALRFNTPMESFPKIMAVYQHTNTLESFIQASPDA